MANIKVQDILNLLNSTNVSCMHLGKFDNQISYASGKTLLRLLNEKKAKYAYEKFGKDGKTYYDIIVAYKNASRRERRETKGFRECYLLAMKNIDKLKEIDDNEKIINDLERKVYGNK